MGSDVTAATVIGCEMEDRVHIGRRSIREFLAFEITFENLDLRFDCIEVSDLAARKVIGNSNVCTLFDQVLD
jgi:hypothetical protein